MVPKLQGTVSLKFLDQRMSKMVPSPSNWNQIYPREQKSTLPSRQELQSVINHVKNMVDFIFYEDKHCRYLILLVEKHKPAVFFR